MSQPDGWTIRQTQTSDSPLIRSLLASAERLHQHLDWLTPLEMVEQRPFLVALERGLPVACLAAPPDTGGATWIRLFAVVDQVDPAMAWMALWSATLPLVRAAGVRGAYALVTAPWLTERIASTGFRQVNEVVTLEWRGTAPKNPVQIAASMRSMHPGDIGAVAELDHAAFDPPWQLSDKTLTAAFRQHGFASVIESNERIVGYQISTESAFGLHLARIAVHPEWQQNSLGKALVTAVQRESQARGFDCVTVNTQSDNRRGHQMYVNLGFRETGHVFPVYELAV